MDDVNSLVGVVFSGLSALIVESVADEGGLSSGGGPHAG
jgi:hypothetical protein